MTYALIVLLLYKVLLWWALFKS